MKQLQGRVAVITGAASGIGLALAQHCAAHAMQVVLADVEEGALSQATRALEAAGAAVLAQPTDVSSAADVEALARATLSRFGAVHLLCNNAGVVTAGPLHELSLGDWHWVLGVNLWGAIHGVKAFLPILLEQDEAHVVSTASTAGLVAAPHLGPYNVSKFGVVALMETLARELAITKARVGVSVLCPGPIDTRIVDAERNRPEGLRAGHVETREERAFLSSAKAQLAEGLAPARVAELVLDAVRAQRFWILTHPEWKPLLERRLAALIEHDALPPRYP